MMVRRDFDLNSVYAHDDSVKDVLKQTMLDQEVTFRNQVHELHRLYGTQRTLMVDSGWKDFESCDLWTGRTRSTVMPIMDSFRYDQMAIETTYSSISTVGSAKSLSQDFSEEHSGVYYKFQHSPLDIQLSSAQCINRVDNVWNHSPETVVISDSEDLKLSLSIGHEKRRNGANKGKSQIVIIDLEEDCEAMPDEGASQAHTLGFSAPRPYFGGKNESQVSVVSDQIISRSVNKDSTRGLEQHPCDNLPTKKQRCSLSSRAVLPDLNTVQLDDSSSYSNDTLIAYPSTASSSDVICGLVGNAREGSSVPAIKTTLNYSVVNSHPPQQETAANLDLVDLNIKVKNIGSESVSGSALGLSEELGSCSNDRKKDNVCIAESTLELIEVVNGRNQVCLAEDKVFTCSDRSQDTVQDWDGAKSPPSCKSQSTIDNDVSSVKTKESATGLGNSGFSVSDKLSRTLSPDLDGRSSDSSEVKNEGYKNKKGSSAGLDVFILSAAESLFHISTKEGFNEVEKENEQKEQPECSCDSYEEMTLKIEESNVDEVSSKPFEVDDLSEMKDFGLKLRRGRRLKDFQKDILPGLASLARHEICEDINIMEGVLRSREYRKMRGKMADGEDWSSLPSRRRSTRGKRRNRR